MSDITEAVAQESIADSLLGPPTHVMTTNPATGNASLLTLDEAGLEAVEYADDYPQEAEPEAEQEQIAEGDWTPDPSAEEELQELQYDLRDEMAQQLAEQQLQEAQGPDEVGQALEQAVEKYGLTHPELNDAIGTSFAEALAAPAETVNADILGGLWAKAQLSASEIYQQTGGDASKVGPVSVDAGRMVTREFLAGVGVDPRAESLVSDSQAQSLGHFFLAIGWNLERSIAEYGDSVQNDPAYALDALRTFYQIVGADPDQADVSKALRVADTLLQQRLYMGEQANRHRAAQPSASRQSQPSNQRRSAQRFQTNSDIFDGAAEIYRSRHGAL